MPVYEYRCDDCERTFEMRRSYSESDSPAGCPQCRGQHTHRLLSNFVAFSSSSGGESTHIAGGGGCAGCSGGNCATCSN